MSNLSPARHSRDEQSTNEKVWRIFRPLVASIGVLVVSGAVAWFVMPKLVSLVRYHVQYWIAELNGQTRQRVDRQVLLILILLYSFLLAYIAGVLGSSHLVGAFMGGNMHANANAHAHETHTTHAHSNEQANAHDTRARTRKHTRIKHADIHAHTFYICHDILCLLLCFLLCDRLFLLRCTRCDSILGAHSRPGATMAHNDLLRFDWLSCARRQNVHTKYSSLWMHFDIAFIFGQACHRCICHPLPLRLVCLRSFYAYTQCKPHTNK